MYRKLAMEPNPENYIKCMQDDILSRNNTLAELVRVISRTPSGLSVVVDGKWGAGKTFFVRQLELLLNHFRRESYKLDVQPEVQRAIKSSPALSKLQLNEVLLPIYFNAWKYDDQKDPILSIFYEIISVFDDLDSMAFESKSVGKKLGTIFEAVNFKFGSNVLGVLETFKGDDILASIRQSEKIESLIHGLIDELLGEECHKLVLIIDELDRCRPSYAVEVLERVKHYFSNDRLVVVYAANREQLSYTISNLYGSDFDSSKYLNRFFDMNYVLPADGGNESFLRSIGVDDGPSYTDATAKCTVDYFGFSLRDSCLFYEIYDTVEPILRRVTHGKTLLHLVFVPFMIALRLSNIPDSREFESGDGFEHLEHFVYSSNTVEFYLKEMIAEIYGKEPNNHALLASVDGGKDYTIQQLEKVYSATFDPLYSLEDVGEEINRFRLNKKTLLQYVVGVTGS